MQYIEYINLLKNKGIELFDYQYRMSYYEIFNNNLQKGGSVNTLYSNLLLEKTKQELEIIVDVSLSKNPDLLSLLL